MARKVRSLHHNKEDGKDIQGHREHRSKRGRNKMGRENSFAFRLYKLRKKGYID